MKSKRVSTLFYIFFFALFSSKFRVHIFHNRDDLLVSHEKCVIVKLLLCFKNM